MMMRERAESPQWVDGLKSKSSSRIPSSFPLGGWFMKKLFSLEWKAFLKTISAPSSRGAEIKVWKASPQP